MYECTITFIILLPHGMVDTAKPHLYSERTPNLFMIRVGDKITRSALYWEFSTGQLHTFTCEITENAIMAVGV